MGNFHYLTLEFFVQR